MSAPQWAPVDDDTADLLTVLADPTPIPGSADAEWRIYVLALRTLAAMHDGKIPANALRPTVRGVVSAPRIGAFCRRAQLEGLIVADGWSVSDDHESGNAGRPCRDYRWTGAQDVPATVVGVDDSLALHGIDRPVVDAIGAL